MWHVHLARFTGEDARGTFELTHYPVSSPNPLPKTSGVRNLVVQFSENGRFFEGKTVLCIELRVRFDHNFFPAMATRS
jgi:hypothetical protein